MGFLEIPYHMVENPYHMVEKHVIRGFNYCAQIKGKLEKSLYR